MSVLFLDWIVNQIKSNDGELYRISMLVHTKPAEAIEWIRTSLPGWTRAATFSKQRVSGLLVSPKEVHAYLTRQLPRYPAMP